MPTYAPQLQAFRNRVNYLEPNLDPIYKGLDIRQQRHDNLQSNYANYVDSVVKDETLDPVEKQKRLDGLKDTVYNMYNKYNGNLSDARDEVMNLIVENRKDPYWSLDRQRTAGYNDMKKQSASLAAQGLTPLYQDATGRYLQDPMERFKSLTDASGNYVNPAQFNVMPTKQLDYEAYFDNVLKTIKANVSDLGLGHKMSDNEMADLVKGYLTTGKIASTDANINRSLPGILENFKMSPEWKQMEGVYGSEQAGILANNMMKNAANRYRYTQQDVNYSPIQYSADEIKNKKTTDSGPMIDMLYKGKYKPVSEQFTNLTDKQGKVLDPNKYKNITKSIENGIISPNVMLAGDITGKTADIVDYAKYIPFIGGAAGVLSKGLSSLSEKLVESSMTKPQNMSDEEFKKLKTSSINELKNLWEEQGFDTKEAISKIQSIEGINNNIGKISKNARNLPIEGKLDFSTKIYSNYKQEPYYTPSDNSQVVRGFEDFLTSGLGTDLSNYTIKKVNEDGTTGEVLTDYADIAETYKRGKGTPLQFTNKDNEFGIITTNENGEDPIFIPLNNNVQVQAKAMIDYGKLYDNLKINPEKSKFQPYVSSKNEDLDKYTTVLPTENGDYTVISNDDVNKEIEKYYQQGYDNSDIVNIFANKYAVMEHGKFYDYLMNSIDFTEKAKTTKP